MEPLEKQAVRLMVFRMVIALTFFLSALGIQATVGTELAIQPFFYFMAVVLAMNLAYSVAYWLLPSVRNRQGFIYTQLCGDAVSVTLLSFLTGGLTSIFTFLYHILIVVAGVILKRRGAFTLAAANALLYGSLCLVQFYGWLEPDRFVKIPYEQPTPGATLYGLMTHLVGFLLVAFLITAMASRLERSDATLGLVRKDLSRLRHLNDQIVSSISGGLVTADERGMVTFANVAARKLFGETLPEGWNLFHRLQTLGHDDSIGEPPRSADPREMHLTTADERRLHVSVSPLMDGGARVGYLALVRDETDMARLRESLSLRERLAAIGEMAANIAHEIKNPLGSISGAAQMLRREADPDSKESELLGIIQNESSRLAQTLDNFLKYVKPTPLKLERVDLRTVAGDILTLFSQDPAVVGGAVKVEHDFPDSPTEAEVDANQVRQALWNLVQNAKKALPAQGGLIRISLRREEPYVMLEVRDNGVGMPKSEIQKSFEPFRHRFASGAGLGLSMVYRIMESHGGRVEVNSEYGSGTTCSLFFPVGAING
jgi:two-component system sensor histidine kinase PilS (NtrC family)